MRKRLEVEAGQLDQLLIDYPMLQILSREQLEPFHEKAMRAAEKTGKPIPHTRMGTRMLRESMAKLATQHYAELFARLPLPVRKNPPSYAALAKQLQTNAERHEVAISRLTSALDVGISTVIRLFRAEASAGSKALSGISNHLRKWDMEFSAVCQQNLERAQHIGELRAQVIELKQKVNYLSSATFRQELAKLDREQAVADEKEMKRMFGPVDIVARVRSFFNKGD